MLLTNHSFPSLSLPALSLQPNGEMFSFKLCRQVDIPDGDITDHFTRLLGLHFEADWRYACVCVLCVLHKNIDDYFTHLWTMTSQVLSPPRLVLLNAIICTHS